MIRQFLTRSVVLSLAACPLAGVAQSIDQISPRLSSFRVGVFCAPDVIDTTPAPDTVAGVTNVIEDVPEFEIGRAHV